MSQPVVDVRPAVAGDAAALAPRLRAQDRAELEAYGSHDHRADLERCIGSSCWAFTVLIDGQVAAVFGVAPGHGYGVPWMLGSDLVARHRRVLARLAPTYIARMLSEHGRLWNTVHARNDVAVKWLNGMGFRLHASRPNAKTGQPFMGFEMP